MSAEIEKSYLKSLARLQRLHVIFILTAILWLEGLGGGCLAFANAHLFEDAEAGDREAQYTLAQLYQKGQGGVDKNIEHALLWFRRAAEAGHEDSMYSLAMLLLAGQTVNGQSVESYHWLEKAAEAGHADSQYALGRAYGVGDPEKSVYWLKQAVLNGHKDASTFLIELCEAGPALCD